MVVAVGLVAAAFPLRAQELPAAAHVESEPFQVLRRIAVDPGHGGDEPGCVGVSGVPEKVLTLLTAEVLAQTLAPHVDWVALSREGDDTLPLESRTGWANLQQADLLLSIHYNCATNPGANGVEVWFLHPDGTVPGDLAPGREGDPELPVGELSAAGMLGAFELEDLRRLGAMWRAAEIAEHLQPSLVRGTGMMDRGVRQAQFRVLRGARMPALVLELGFLTHAREGEAVFEAERVESVVQAILEGLRAADRELAATIFH